MGIGLSPDEPIRGDFNINLVPKSSIGDTVYCDLNNNGNQEDTEPGIPDVTVNLSCTLSDDSVFTDTQETDPSGKYLFTDIPAPAQCDVTVDESTAPDDKVTGKCPTEFDVDLEPDQVFLDADFCFIFPGEIGDTVYCDLDNDGVQDNNEPGIPGVTVTLICDGEPERTTETDGDGKYLFTQVPLNVDCTVIVDQNSTPALDDKVIGECPPDFDVTLNSDDPSFLDADFCFIFPGEIGDTVYCDLDNDGVQDDDEPGIPGVTVTLICDGEPERTTVTNADGMYLFTQVPLNVDCTVTVDQDSAPALDDKVIGECPPDFDVTLNSDNPSFLDADFCFIFPGEIGDTVFCDLDNDGVQDDNEPGIPGVTVTLICDGEPERTAVTDADGMYLFTQVPLNVNCTVIVDQNSTPALDDKVIGECPPDFDVTLDSDNPSFLDADFCFIFPGEIGDTVYCDLDNDGVQDNNEPGIPGVTVTLICDSEPERTAVTDADGMYLFTQVPLNVDCTVTVDQNSAPALDDKVIGECPPDFDVTLNSDNPSFLDADFCFIFPGEIGDTVYCDLDNDGVQDDNEPGIPGVTVTLICDGEPERTAVTDSDGMYLFTQVPLNVNCTVIVDQNSTPALDDKVIGECPPDFDVTLNSDNPSFLDADFCFIFKDCTVIVEKTCEILPVFPEPGVSTCKDLKEVTALTMIWDGPDGINIAVEDGETITGIQNGDVVTFSTPKKDTNLTITGAVNGRSNFHVSCSDKEMNGSEDCGKFAGNGKKNDSSLNNQWIFAGMTGEKGQFTCPIAQPDPSGFPRETEECVFTPRPAPGASTCKDIKKITALSMIWDGPSGINIAVEDGETISGIQNGDLVTFSAPKSDTKVTISGAINGRSEFHLSCSDKEMNGIEDCGNFAGNGKKNDSSLNNQWIFAGMIGEKGQFSCPGVPGGSGDSAEVLYGFRIENTNDEAIEVNIVDEQLDIDRMETIAANSTFELVTEPFTVTPDDTDVFENTVVVTGTTVSGATCAAMDTVKVKRNSAPPPSDGPVCDSKIAATTLRYIGPSINGATVEFVGKSEGLATYSNVDLISGETILTQSNGLTVDGRPKDLGSKLSIFINGVEEKIHTSCSTPYVAGQPAPLDKPKGAPSRNWFVVNFIEKN